VTGECGVLIAQFGLFFDRLFGVDSDIGLSVAGVPREVTGEITAVAPLVDAIGQQLLITV